MIDYYHIIDPVEMDSEVSGKGLRKCLFILSTGDFEKGETKLGEILKAIKLDKNKDILIWLTRGIDTQQLIAIKNEYGIEKVVSFGMEVNEVFPNMIINDYANLNMEFLQWLSVPELSFILDSRDEKMKLWKALQSLFLNG